MSIIQIINNYFLDKCPLYQPVFGHPEFDTMVKNSDYSKRIEVICNIIREFQKCTKKDVIKILDIGSAEGYIDFCLKKIFGKSISITCYEQNPGSIELSKAINIENNFDISFNKAVESNIELVNNFKDNEFDIVFLFNVLHWTSLQEGGWQNSQKWVNILAKKTNFLLLELAGYNTNNINRCPKLYDDWFQNISYYKRMEIFPHFVDKSLRPLYFASNKYVYLKGKFYSIEHFSNSFNGMKRAFLCTNQLIKIVYKKVPNSYNVTWNECIVELKNEINNCCNLKVSFFPSFIYQEESSEDFCTIFKLNKIGTNNIKFNVYDYNKSLKKIINILDNLIELEEKNLYHYDLTIWNVMENQNEAFLIDYGAIINKNIVDGGNAILNKICKNSHYNSYDAFMSIVIDYLSSYDKLFDASRLFIFIPTIFYSKDLEFPQTIKNFLIKYQSIKRNELSFKIIKKIFIKYVINNEKLNLSDEEKLVYGFEYEKRRLDFNRLQLYLLSKIIDNNPFKNI